MAHTATVPLGTSCCIDGVTSRERVAVRIAQDFFTLQVPMR